MAMESLRIAAKESKIMKFVLGGFILLAVGGLVFTDVRGFFTGGVANTDIAKIGSTKISLQEFDRELRRALQQSNMIAEDAYEAGLVNAYLEGRIESILKLQSAEDLGLNMNNAMIAAQIRTMFGDMARDQIEMVIRSQGLSEEMLASSIRRDTLLGIVSVLPLAVGNYVPDYIQQAEARLMAERRGGTVYTIPLESYAENVEVTDADIQTYYDSNPQFFTIPEQRQFTIGTMTVERAANNIPPLTEDDVRAEYEDRLSDFALDETRNIAQANLDNPDDAQAVYEAALNGTPLKTALEQVTGNADGFRETASYAQDGIPAELAERAFASNIQAGDITPPVRTLLGYTVMKVADIIPARQQEFEEVRAALSEELEETRLYDVLYNKMLDTEDMIDGGQSFAMIAEETDLETNTTEFYTQNAIITAEQEVLSQIIQGSPSTLEEIYSLPEGGVTYPFELDDGSYAIIGIQAIQRAELRPLDNVSDEIVTALTNQRLRTIADQTLAAQVSSTDAIDIPSTATSEAFSGLSRDSDKAYKALAYQARVDGYAYQVNNDDVTLVLVDAVRFADIDDEAVTQDALIQAQITAIDSLLTQYYRDNTSISVNDRLLERTYGANQDL